MNYERIYNAIISKAKSEDRKRDKGYTDSQILESLFTLNPDNEFYLMMLHCLIDLKEL